MTATTSGLLPSGAQATESVMRHYTDTSDNPTWVVSDSGVLTRYASPLGGDMSLTLTGSGASLAVANPHGGVVTTIPLPAVGDATQIPGCGDYTEYGTPTTPAATQANGTVTGYGWVGAKERATAGETFGITLMGARYDNPTTGRFTSTDPIYGGNPNTYTHPTNPTTGYDLDGLSAGGRDTQTEGGGDVGRPRGSGTGPGGGNGAGGVSGGGKAYVPVGRGPYRVTRVTWGDRRDHVYRLARIRVGGVLFEFGAMVFPGGWVNVGTYYPVR